MPFIEIKTRERIDKGLADSIVSKGTVTAVVTSGIISAKAKIIFNENGIAWAENIPESEFMNQGEDSDGNSFL